MNKEAPCPRSLCFSAWPPAARQAVNLSGSFLIGFLSVLLLQKYPDPRLAAFLIAGFLGGLTTFPSFINEGLQFLLAGRPETGLLYMAGETAAGLAAAALGVFLGRFFV